MDTPDLVEVVNPNGQKGLVAATSDAAEHYKRPPSAKDDEAKAPAASKEK